MEFFNSAIEVLQTLVVALGAGLGVWGAINLLEGYGNDTPARPTMPLERTTAPSTGLIMTPFTAMCCGKSGNVPELP